MNINDIVLINSQVTRTVELIGIITKIENNPFVGIVITAETEDGNIFFEREDMFKPITNLDNPSPSNDPFWDNPLNVAKLNKDIETLKTRKASDFISLEQFNEQIKTSK